jgi:hypothetical protein
MENNVKDDTGVRVEAFLQQCQFEGKTGVRIPWTEKDAKERIEFFECLYKKGLITEETCRDKSEEVWSMSLSEDMYQEFYELLAYYLFERNVTNVRDM